MEHVRAYTRKDGTHVAAYTRKITARDRAIDAANGRKAKGSHWKKKSKSK